MTSVGCVVSEPLSQSDDFFGGEITNYLQSDYFVNVVPSTWPRTNMKRCWQFGGLKQAAALPQHFSYWKSVTTCGGGKSALYNRSSGCFNNCYTKTWIWSSPVSMALLSFFFHCSATSFARGSSGLGALNNAWIDSNTVRICRAGDHLSGRRQVQ